MKLTETGSKIKPVMHTCWNSYLYGDLEIWSSYLFDHYQNIGTTQEEIWNSKQDIVDYKNRLINFNIRNSAKNMYALNEIWSSEWRWIDGAVIMSDPELSLGFGLNPYVSETENHGNYINPNDC